MTIEPGMVAVIAATLVFYLRLIILQRERAKQAAKFSSEAEKTSARRSPKTSKAKTDQTPNYSILSPRRRDWVIAGIGFCGIVIGILANRGVLPLVGVLDFWWVPTAVGIVAFSWAFRL